MNACNSENYNCEPGPQRKYKTQSSKPKRGTPTFLPLIL